MRKVAASVMALVCVGLRWLWLTLRSTSAVEAENLFLRRQLALYVERGVKPRRIDSVTRIALTILSGFFAWRDALVVVRPETLLRWHRQGWKLLWRLKSRPGRPSIPSRLQALIRQMARENPSWGEERIANELRLKLGIEVSPRTVRKYLPPSPRGRPQGGLRWSTFLRTHAQGILACDFFVTVTATFRLLYVFVVIEHGSRRLVHVNVTAQASAAWTLQQLREVVGLGSRHRFLIHDRDCIFSAELDRSITALGVRVLKSAPRSPRMNALCERVIGTIRRECLDWLIPLSEAHHSLQSRAPTHGVGSGGSRSADTADCETDIPPSPRRTLRRARPPDPRRTPSRVHGELQFCAAWRWLSQTCKVVGARSWSQACGSG